MIYHIPLTKFNLVKSQLDGVIFYRPINKEVMLVKKVCYVKGLHQLLVSLSTK